MTRQIYDPRKGTILVTGASSGIGAAIVRQLRGDGRDVMAIARRTDRLSELKTETGCRIATIDICDIEQVEKLVREISPSVIINNAGTAQGIAGLTPDTDIRSAFDINVVAPFHLIRSSIPMMKNAGGGHIITIGSISGLYPIVSALYGASKGAMHMAMQNFRMELRGSGIRVSEIAPGRTDTNLFEASNLDPSARKRLEVSNVKILTPDDVASAVLYALNAPLHVNIGLIELTPTEQAIGGATFTPIS